MCILADSLMQQTEIYAPQVFTGKSSVLYDSSSELGFASAVTKEEFYFDGIK